MANPKLEAYFRRAIADGASDLHLVVGEPPAFRVAGELRILEGEEPVDVRVMGDFVQAILREAQRAQLLKLMEVDVALTVEQERFRVNVHQQRGRIAVAARRIPSSIPSAETIALEPQVLALATHDHGLVLVTGPSGAGKSTTLAVMIEYINATRAAHIVTIEDPIEFVYRRQQSLIEQREVGSDTRDFATALRAALRMDPNVILLGELRDVESVATALIAAETGHLVLATLHAPSAGEAVERIVGLFPAERQQQVLLQLAGTLRGVVAQRLLPRARGGLVAAREIMLGTPAIANLIREHKIAQIPSYLQTAKEAGMQTMAKTIVELQRSGLITEVTAHAAGA